MCEQTFGRTTMHADRQTDGWTDGPKHTPSRTRACKHTNAYIDERTHVRSNIWTHEHACGRTDRQTDKRTDGRTGGRMDSHIRPHARTRACTNTNASMLTRTHDALRYIRTDG